MEPFILADHSQRRLWHRQIRPRLNVVWRGSWDLGRIQASRICFDHELVVFTAGVTRAVVGDLEFTCRAGDVLIQPPGLARFIDDFPGRAELQLGPEGEQIRALHPVWESLRCRAGAQRSQGRPHDRRR